MPAQNPLRGHGRALTSRPRTPRSGRRPSPRGGRRCPGAWSHPARGRLRAPGSRTRRCAGWVAARPDEGADAPGVLHPNLRSGARVGVRSIARDGEPVHPGPGGPDMSDPARGRGKAHLAHDLLGRNMGEVRRDPLHAQITGARHERLPCGSGTIQPDPHPVARVPSGGPWELRDVPQGPADRFAGRIGGAQT